MREDVVDRHRERDEIVAAGESESTPWILIGRVWVVTAVAVLVVLAVTLLAYRLAR
jgi:hypothetical protein